MRIGFVLPSTPGYSETFFRSKISGLITAGHQVVVFAGSNPGKFEICPVIFSPKIYTFLPLRISAVLIKVLLLIISHPVRISRFFIAEKSSGRNLKSIVENIFINSHILKENLDWLHFGFATMAIRRENVAKVIGAKMGVSIRGYDISHYPLKHPGCYNLLWQKVDKIHVISFALMQKAFATNLKQNRPVVKITPAINVKNFNRISPIRKPGTPLKILTVARLKWVKGLEYTLSALAILKNNNINFQYTIIGEGEEYKRLFFAARQLEISNDVIFAGKKTHEEVKQAMEQADFYLQYSVQEGFGNAVLEAQAMGLLCLVSDAEGLPENVLHEKTGWVVPRRNPKLLAEKIIELLHKPENELNQIRNHAVERVRNEFNLEKQQAAFVGFYD